MTGIIHMPNQPWRPLWPASFRQAMFHVEVGSKESGRRIVLHEFPKKDIPYPEDMGRRARSYSVRGYCITFPVQTGIDLYDPDYRKARDALIVQLEAEGPGVLQLPTVDPVTVVCPQYRWSEEERFGGYCVFDMTFVEYGTPTGAQASSRDDLIAQSQAMQDRVLTVMQGLEAQLQATASGAPRMVP